MPFQIIRNDITKVKADAIVNTANPRPCIGRGTDSAIYAAAGEEQLLAERKKIGEIAPGQSASTDAFNLDAKYIIHTVGPAWVDGAHGERDILRSCYETSLELAAELKCKSIAFPLIASGVYGFPKDEALNIPRKRGFVHNVPCFGRTKTHPPIFSQKMNLRVNLWQHRIILRADTASEVCQLLSKKRR